MKKPCFLNQEQWYLLKKWLSENGLVSPIIIGYRLLGGPDILVHVEISNTPSPFCERDNLEMLLRISPKEVQNLGAYSRFISNGGRLQHGIECFQICGGDLTITFNRPGEPKEQKTIRICQY